MALEWDQVRVFLAVFRGGSLAAGAARLGVDVSTVSRRVDRLEEELGLHLFDRTRDGTLATASAELVLPHAEEMELAMHRFAAAGSQVETEVEGVVRLSVPPGVSDTFVAPLLVELHRLHPKLQIEVDATISYADLTRREADIALRVNRPRSGELVMTRLISTRSMPMTSPEYAAELGRLRTLADARWIAWGADLAHIPSSRWLSEHGPGVVPVLRTSHMSTQIAAARSGLGVVLASGPYRRFGLVPIKPGKALAAAWEALPVEELWLVGHQALRQVPRVAAVWEFVLARMSAIDPGDQ